MKMRMTDPNQEFFASYQMDRMAELAHSMKRAPQGQGEGQDINPDPDVIEVRNFEAVSGPFGQTSVYDSATMTLGEGGKSVLDAVFTTDEGKQLPLHYAVDGDEEILGIQRDGHKEVYLRDASGYYTVS